MKVTFDFSPTHDFFDQKRNHHRCASIRVVSCAIEQRCYMAREYVEETNGGYAIAGSRVSLESIVIPFLDGASPETLVDEFPTLSLEQVYGAITFYLAYRAEVDAYLKETEGLWEEARKSQPPIPAALRERLERARRELTSHA